VHDRGLNEALLGAHTAGAAFAEQRRAHTEAFAYLLERARADGAVRGRVSVQDARIALMAITSFRALPADRASDATRRLTGLLLAGLFAGDQPRADASAGPGPGAESGPGPGPR